MPVVTISRMFGAGGSEVARRVADALGWPLLDNGFVERIAAGLRATPAQVAAIDERAPSLAERIADAFAHGSAELLSAPLDAPLPPSEAQVLAVTRRVVEDAAARGPIVLVGRGAQVCLESRRDALHVLCVATEPDLVARVAAREGLSLEAATRRVREVNRERRAYVSRHWDREWLDPARYHACLNTSWLGIDGTAADILSIGRARGIL